MTRACVVEACESETRGAQGMCNAHYLRWRKHKHGDPMVDGWEVRRWDLVDKNGPLFNDRGPCWLWTGRKTADGYGRVQVAGRQKMVHRWSYELLVGPVPDGLELDHLCR